MKNLLILLILSLCAIAWRSDDIVNALSKREFSATTVPLNSHALTTSQNPGQKVMTIEELSYLSKTDPKASRKFINSRTVSERNEADKLMNFFSHGTYE